MANGQEAADLRAQVLKQIAEEIRLGFGQPNTGLNRLILGDEHWFELTGDGFNRWAKAVLKDPAVPPRLNALSNHSGFVSLRHRFGKTRLHVKSDMPFGDHTKQITRYNLWLPDRGNKDTYDITVLNGSKIRDKALVMHLEAAKLVLHDMAVIRKDDQITPPAGFVFA